MTKTETNKLLSMFKAVWSNEEITPGKIEVYHLVLGEFPFAAMQAAALVYLARGKFFPRPADLLEIVAEQAAPAVSAGDAWEIVLKQVRRHGYNGWSDVTFDDPAILAAVKEVGWRRICLEDDTKGYVRHAFGEALAEAQKRVRRDVQTGSALEGGLRALPRIAS